jgi:hypothetical protein
LYSAAGGGARRANPAELALTQQFVHFGFFGRFTIQLGPNQPVNPCRYSAYSSANIWSAELPGSRDNRSEGRSNVFLTALLDAGGGSVAVRIRNLSPKGALIDGTALPTVGAKVRLVRGRLSARGQLTWHADGHAGLQFDGEIDVETWVRRAEHAGQQRVDSVIAGLRQPSPSDAVQETADSPSLRTISATLDDVCERLAQTEPMSAELAEELIRLDVISQHLRKLAGPPKK